VSPQSQKRTGWPWVLGFTGVVTVLLVTGVGLLADLPGPKPDLDVRVDSFKPQGVTDPSVNITVTFTNALVSVDSLSRPTGLVPVEITPDVEGLARWTAPDKLTIYPGRPLEPATEYRATVKAGSGFVNGNAIKRDEHFSFRTPPLAIEIARYQAQRSREHNRKARLVFDLDFNYPVSRERLRDALAVVGRDNASKSGLSVIWVDTTVDGTRVPEQARQYRLATELFDLRDGEQKYQLVIDRGLHCVNCGSGLAVDYTYTMAVPPNPSLDLRVDEVRAERAGRQGTILALFSSPVPVDEAREYIRIEPAVPFSVESHWRGLRLRGDFSPGATYKVVVTPGIMSANGELMQRGFSLSVVMGDLRPEIRFTSPGLYVPRDGSRLLEISTVNIDTLSIEVSQVFANNVVTYLATGADSRRGGYGAVPAYGRSTFVHDFPLESRKNQELISTIDLGTIIGDTLQGVFVVTARGGNSRWINDTRHVLITDIGIMARMSGCFLMVWANSLSQAEPVGKAQVKLFSRNNQLLVQGKTNSKGVVVFPDIGDQVEGYQPFLVTVEKDSDLSYLRLDNSRLAISDFDVSGRPFLTDGYEAFLYLDRGVFRPGDTVRLVSLVRGESGAMPSGFPYLLRIVDPRGRLFREYRISTEQAMTSVDIAMPADVPTGKYAATAYLTDSLVLGRTEFLVEEFVPDRIKVEVRNDRPDYGVGDTMMIEVSGQMLYGAPAAGLKVTSEIALTPTDFRPHGYSSFLFSFPDNEASVRRISLGDARLSDSGTVTLQHIVGPGHRPPSALTAQVWATVSETGGRAVSSYTESKVYPYRRFVGIKANVSGYARTGEPVSAELVVLRPDGTATTADSILVSFARLVFNSMLQKQPDGSYRFISERSEEVIDSAWLTVGPDGARVAFTPVDYGRYRITARDAVGGHSAAVEFFASGWGRVPWSMEEPDRLQLDLDQADYTCGTTARLQIRAPFSGRLLVTVENQTVQDYMVVDLPENTGEIELPVKREYAPNVYVSATLIRPASTIGRGMPARAYGLIPLKVTAEERRLGVTVTVPDEIRPNSDLRFQVRTTGSGNTRLTVAAVDAGILQLTGFETPDPFGFFCGKRRPALDGYDLYSLVYPESDRAASHLSPPGGQADFRSKQHLNPFQARRINVVALWSGVMKADSTGLAEASLPVPQFNGQLAVMAVATDGDRFGSGSASVTVREPIILQESFPRFVAPGDRVRGIVTVFNGLDSAAVITVEAKFRGQAELTDVKSRSFRLEAGQQQTVEFPFAGLSKPGKVDVSLLARAGTEESRARFELANRPASPLLTRYGSGVVTGDSTVAFTLPDEWVNGTARYVLRTSSLSALQMTRNIEYLLSYPYGCVEQTTSRLFPLLYFEDLAKVVRPELLGGKGHEYFLAEGIERLLRFQQADGGFAYWPGSSTVHHWSSIYAAHFLVEAKLAGYDIDKSGYRRALQFLENIARDRNYSDIDTGQRIYACLALAKAGKLDNKLFNYLSGINVGELPGYAAYQLASALALAGDVTAARAIVPFEIQPDLTDPESGGNFSSGVRTDAILLDLLVQIDPQNPSAAVLARSLLERARIARWYNTQETAFALMALGKYFGRIDEVDFSGEIAIEGQDSHRIDQADFVLAADNLGGRRIEISLDGKGPCFYYWQASGVPVKAGEPQYERGISVRREYLDASGNPVDLQNIGLGTQLVGHVAATSIDRGLENVVIADLLPAGFEIENPRLISTPLMPWLPSNPAKADYQDIRDDRVLMFVNLPAGRTLHFYYGLRTVSAGDFVVPPVAAECMYNPLVAGAGSSDRVVVTRSDDENQ